MALRWRLLLWSAPVVLLLALGSAAIQINNLIAAELRGAQRLAEFAAQQTRILLLLRLEDYWRQSVPAGDGDRRERWIREVAADRRLQQILSDAAVQSPALIEINIAGADGKLLASSMPRVGATLKSRESLASIGALNPWERARRLYSTSADYEARLAIGPLDDPRPLFQVQVLASSVLLRENLRGPLQRVAAGTLLGLLIALASLYFLAGWIARNVNRIGEAIDRIHRGELPETAAGRGEFSAVEEKLSLLGHQVRDREQGVQDLRARVASALETFEEGLLLLDAEQRITLSGGAANRLLRWMGYELPGRSLDEVIPAASPLGRTVRDLLSGDAATADAVSLWDRDGEPARLAVSVHRLPDGGALVRMRDAEGRREFASQVELLARLEAMNRLTGGVAHEIKNPLNSIAARLALLEDAIGESSPEAEEEIRVIAEEVDRLDRVVRTFLDFTRPVQMKREPLDLAALLHEVAESIEPEAVVHDVSLDCKTVPDRILLSGDADLLRQALLNLSVNAIEAMPAGGRLTLDAMVHGAMCRVLVADTGVGIPAEKRERIFDLYFTTKKGGSGLGLALVFRAVQLHGGTIEAESEPGQGTRFLITLPTGE